VGQEAQSSSRLRSSGRGVACDGSEADAAADGRLDGPAERFSLCVDRLLTSMLVIFRRDSIGPTRDPTYVSAVIRRGPDSSLFIRRGGWDGVHGAISIGSRLAWDHSGLVVAGIPDLSILFRGDVPRRARTTREVRRDLISVSVLMALGVLWAGRAPAFARTGVERPPKAIPTAQSRGFGQTRDVGLSSPAVILTQAMHRASGRTRGLRKSFAPQAKTDTGSENPRSAPF